MKAPNEEGAEPDSRRAKKTNRSKITRKLAGGKSACAQTRLTWRAAA
jgi:hypothetical protein